MWARVDFHRPAEGLMHLGNVLQAVMIKDSRKTSIVLVELCIVLL